MNKSGDFLTIWQKVGGDIFEINILIYEKSYHRGDCLICLLIVSASRTIFLLLFLLHFPASDGSSLYSSPNW